LKEQLNGKVPLEIAKEVLKLEADAIIIERQLGDEFEKPSNILERKGRVLVIAFKESQVTWGRKMPPTLASTGQPAFFIHATRLASW